MVQSQNGKKKGGFLMIDNLIEINPNSVKTKKLYRDLFPYDNNIKNVIKEDMEANGYDKSKPIDVWNDICIDGHTRLQSAKEANVKVVVFKHDFKNEDEALEYAIHNQRDRRNMTDADILNCVQILDKRKTKSEAGAMKGKQTLDGVSSETTAKTIGVSRSKVEKARTVLDHADDDIKKSVETGQITINRAYETTQEKRKIIETKHTFNIANDKIEWAKWSWNPVTGCEHGCKYCYARDIANRFYKQGFKPTFYKNRLTAPNNTNIPNSRINEEGIKNVFVCSMADLFGDWVPDEWIKSVLCVVKSNPQWNYIFLTKNPKRLTKIDFPDNAWVGTTVDTQSRVLPAENAFKNVSAKVKFVSCEPFLEEITFNELDIFDWLIIGGQSSTTSVNEFQPKWEWVEHLIKQARKAKCKVYMKPNLKIRPKEWPANKEKT